MQTFRATATFTAQSHLIAALHRLYNAVDRTQKSPADLLPIVVFMAFSIEAYLNQLGVQQRVFRDDPQNKLQWKQKFELLHQHCGKTAIWGHEPLQFARAIFDLRDRLAHGRRDTVIGPDFSSQQDADEFIVNDEMEPEWFKEIDSDWLDKSAAKFETLMEYLAKLHGLSPTDYFKQSSRWVYLKDSDFN
ncbi:hypothetical protein [Methylomonas sp. TEB]|uniref:hypothetical protein n=1 Tax=Methylomonas sp. TEB TaxID=3398229 RepID=UPI0039F5D31F